MEKIQPKGENTNGDKPYLGFLLSVGRATVHLKVTVMPVESELYFYA